MDDNYGTVLQEAAPLTALDVALKEIEGLQRALESRTTIGQAIGIVMTERRVTTEAAFAHLVETSSHSNVKIRDIAAAIVADADRRAAQS